MARRLATFGSVLAFASVAFAGQPEVEPKGPPGKEPYAELSRLIRTLAVKHAPREFDDLSGWGKSAPPPKTLRLPNLLKRTTIQVGDRVEYAHGLWRKTKVKLENPERDLTLRVTSIKPGEGLTYRVGVEAQAKVRTENEFQQWLNGVLLVGLSAPAKATVRADLDCDVKVSLDVSKFPPGVTVDPKIVASTLSLEKFELFDPNLAKRPQLALDLNAELRQLLNGALRSAEPKIREEANKAVAQALRDGKAGVSAVEVYKAFTSGK